MRALTYDEWKSAGYFIKKGERSQQKNRQGEPTFTRDQVEEWRNFDRENNLRYERDDT
jgi:hypothetical protein